jgi:hypothetical protein
MNDDIDHKQTLLGLYRRRLRERELQEATYGLSADPVIKIEIADLKQRIQSLENEIGMPQSNMPQSYPTTYIPSSPLNVVQEILDLLEITYITFVAQCRVRDKLVEMLYNRLEIQAVYQYEELFSRYYDQMNTEERHFHKSLRTYTENTLYVHNNRILELIRKNLDLEQDIPSLKLLRQHLILWISKYDGLFQTTPSMALVYVGVEEKVPFPKKVQQELRAYLTKHTPSLPKRSTTLDKSTTG